jgi:uncharacterized protein YbcI
MSSDPSRRIHCLRPLQSVPEAASSEPQPSDRPSHPEATAPMALSAEPTDARADLPSGEKGFADGETAAAISRAIVGVVRTRTGRGPSKAKTAMSVDLAIVTLGDYLTAAEKTLVSEGGTALAKRFRTALHDGMRAEAVAAVEAITGRQVAAHLAAHDHDPERAIIAFHFSPRTYLKGV